MFLELPKGELVNLFNVNSVFQIQPSKALPNHHPITEIIFRGGTSTSFDGTPEDFKKMLQDQGFWSTGRSITPATLKP